MLYAAVVFHYWIICAMVAYGSTCGPPTPPRGSVIIHPPNQEKYERGSVILFGCKQGFYLVGKPIIKCLGSTWTQRQFRCVGFCPEVSQISNGQVIETRTNIGQAAVEFRCNGKFRLVGTPRLECIDGRWNGKLPFCQKLVSCPRLRAPPNATLHGSDTTHGAKANFACLTGFDLFGSPSLTCNDGVWSTNVPTCKAYCMKIRDLPNGRKFGTGFSHGRVVSFECKLGFELVGDRALRCIHGRWNSSVPVCKATLCSKPSIPSNSYIIYPQTNHVKYTHGTHVFLACRDGYFLKGSPIMVCNQTVWLKREFSCIASCTVVDSIKNGIITHTTLKEGGEVEIACLTNFTLVGSAKLTCINGKWSDNLPSCKEPCPDPGRPHQGNRIGGDFRHGKPVTFTCPRDYVMEGLRTIKCSDGRWSNEKPSCKAPCEELVPPAHGRRMGEDFRHGRSAKFICSYGYARIGASTIRCNDGNWSNPTPVCKGICPQLRPPYKGRLHGNKVRFLDGEEATFSCENNHDLFGKARLRCVGKKWDFSVPECKASCDTLTAVPNGKVNGSYLKHGSLAHFSCNTGFQLEGPKQITCIDGKWNSISPTCKVVQCDDPGIPANGARIVKRGFVYGGSVTFTCNKDYTLRGTSTIYCQENKKWTGSVPRCLAPCPDPGRPYQGNRIGDDFRHDRTVTFTCPKDYIMEGLRTITCSDGRWRYRKPSCKAPCNELAPPAHGQRSGEDFRHGRSVRFYCSIGHTTIGASVIKCNDGNWNSPAPVCKASCDDPGFLAKGRKIGNDYSHGQIVTYECTTQGYSLVGNPILTCNDGSWDSQRPECKGICKNPGLLDNGKVIGNDYSYNSSIKFQCNFGYDLLGPASLTCNKDTWNGGIPACKKRCQDPGKPRNGWKIGMNYSHGGSVQFVCKAGPFDLVGASRITCDEGGWSHHLPSCEARCSDPGTPNNGAKDGGNFRSRANVTFRCNPPLELTGSRVIFCQDGEWSDSRPTCSNCARPLGLEKNKNWIRSPSSLTDFRYPPNAARLNGPSAWCPLRTPAYLQIDLDKIYKLTAIATQGGKIRNKWIQRYTISFMAGKTIVYYTESGSRKDIPGNKDASSLVEYKFKEPFVTSVVRINPSSSPNVPICLRVELYGCDPNPDCILVGSMFWGYWKYIHEAINYYEAYIIKLTATHLDFVLQVDNTLTRTYRRNDPVLIIDRVPKMKDISINSSVIAHQHDHLPDRYRSGTVMRFPSASLVSVKFDDGETLSVPLKHLRLVNRPRFCVNDI